MKRREVIATLAAVAAGPLLLPAHAQTSGVRRIGVIYHGGPYKVSIEGLREGLRAPASGLSRKRSRVNTSTVT
jgi:putative ABC transport system substrate-binding protein